MPVMNVDVAASCDNDKGDVEPAKSLTAKVPTSKSVRRIRQTENTISLAVEESHASTKFADVGKNDEDSISAGADEPKVKWRNGEKLYAENHQTAPVNNKNPVYTTTLALPATGLHDNIHADNAMNLDMDANLFRDGVDDENIFRLNATSMRPILKLA